MIPTWIGTNRSPRLNRSRVGTNYASSFLMNTDFPIRPCTFHKLNLGIASNLPHQTQASGLCCQQTFSANQDPAVGYCNILTRFLPVAACTPSVYPSLFLRQVRLGVHLCHGTIGTSAAHPSTCARSFKDVFAILGNSNLRWTGSSHRWHRKAGKSDFAICSRRHLGFR